MRMWNSAAVRLAAKIKLRIQEKKSFLGAVACVLHSIVDRAEPATSDPFVVCARVWKMLEETECHGRFNTPARAFGTNSNQITIRNARVEHTGHQSLSEARENLEPLYDERVPELHGVA